MNKAKVALAADKTVSVVLKVIGIIDVVFWSIGVLIFLADYDKYDYSSTMIIVYLILAGLGVWMIRISNKKARLIETFRKYVAVISNVPNGFIPDIANALNTSVDVVMKNLELMIKKGYFVNAYIDRNLNSIIIANRQAIVNEVEQTKTAVTQPKKSVQNVQMVTVKCEGCGAVNSVPKGSVGECEYCGSPIKGK